MANKDKFNAILSYIFLFGFIIVLKREKSKYLIKHIKKGNMLNILVIIWLTLAILINRFVVGLLPLGESALNLIRSILVFVNAFIAILFLIYQIYAIRKVIKS